MSAGHEADRDRPSNHFDFGVQELYDHLILEHPESHDVEIGDCTFAAVEDQLHRLHRQLHARRN